MLDFEVAANGRIENPRVKEATHPAFGAAALAALAQSHFVPAVEDGTAVVATASLPFNFAP